MANKRKIIVLENRKSKLFFIGKLLTLLLVIYLMVHPFIQFYFSPSFMLDDLRKWHNKLHQWFSLIKKENLKCETNGGFSVFIHSRKNYILIIVLANHIVSRIVLPRSQLDITYQIFYLSFRLIMLLKAKYPRVHIRRYIYFGLLFSKNWFRNLPPPPPR